MIVFSELSDSSVRTITYYGELPTGMIITIQINGEVSGKFSLLKISTQEKLTIDLSKIESILGSSLETGDLIIISTMKRLKYVRHLRNGVYTNVLNILDKSSNWLQLDVGNNDFSFSVETGVDNLSIELSNNIAYEGI